MELKLAFIGFGNVARAFARILNDRRSPLAERYDLRWRATAIATANHGCVLSTAGIDLNEAVTRLERGESLLDIPGTSAVATPMEVVEACDADILFETSTLSPTDGEPATSYIRRALARGINVVTANKGPVAFAYREMKALARDHNAHFRFEGTVMDGAPVFNMVEYCLPATQVTGFYGALNSTTNIILTGMESGKSFDESLNKARDLGIAEANADYDIDGWDAAVKAVVLANVLMGADARPCDVERRGIRDIKSADLESATLAGSVVRLVTRADKSPEGLRICVAPEAVPVASPLGNARGSTNVLVIKTDLMGELAIFETDPGVTQTAYALLSDMLRIYDELRAARAG